MQSIICTIRDCGYCSANGFCLNRLVKINEQGICSYLQKPGWNQQVDKKFKSNYNPWEEEQEIEEERVTLAELLESRQPVENSEETSEKKDQDYSESGKDRPPRD